MPEFFSCTPAVVDAVLLAVFHGHRTRAAPLLPLFAADGSVCTAPTACGSVACCLPFALLWACEGSPMGRLANVPLWLLPDRARRDAWDSSDTLAPLLSTSPFSMSCPAV